MPTTFFTWELVVECSVAVQYYLKSQPHYTANYYFINIKAILASHEGIHMVMISRGIARITQRGVLNSVDPCSVQTDSLTDKTLGHQR